MYILGDIGNTETKIFLVSTNRSGSSLITSIIRQHPKLRSLDDEVLKTELGKGTSFQISLKKST